MSPADRFHALLIGIDAYDGIDALHGCVNDIDGIQGILVERMRVPPARIRRLAAPRFGAAHRTDVEETLPTRKNIIDALTRLAATVAPSDRVLIYYSGHGTQLTIRATDDLVFSREALLPKDFRSGLTRQYLPDWELARLMGKIAARTDCISLIVDACNSAGATRDVSEMLRGPSVRERYFPVPEVVELPAGAAPPVEDRGLSGLASGPMRNCMVVAACLDDERARESDAGTGDPTRQHGELTRALLAELAAIPDEALWQVPWTNLWRPLLAAVSQASPSQHPWMSSNPARAVFGGPQVDFDLGYGVTFDGLRYRIDAGTLFGVDEMARLGVYGPSPSIFPDVDSPADLAARLGVLRVTLAEETRAIAEPEEPHAPLSPLPAGARCRLLSTRLGARLVVALRPREDGLVAALAGSGLLAVAGEGIAASVTLVQQPPGWRVTDHIFGDGTDPAAPLLPLIVTDDPAVMRRALEHYVRFSEPLRVARRASDLPAAIRIVLLDCREGLLATVTDAQSSDPPLPQLSPGPDGTFRLRAAPEPAGGPAADCFCFRLENVSTRDLHVTLLHCAGEGNVTVLADRLNVKASGRAVVWHPDGPRTPFVGTIQPSERTTVDQVVAIATSAGGVSWRALATTDTFRTSVLPGDRGDAEEAPGILPAVYGAAVRVLRVFR